MRRRCAIITLSDGSQARVQGDLPVEDVEKLAAMAQRLMDATCKHAGPFVMPERAQRMHMRETYICGLLAGHRGRHAWGSREWD